MKRLEIAAGILAVMALLGTGLVAGESIKSGPQVGEEVPGPFHPLNVTGAHAGEKFCLYCKNGSNPVAMIFAREVSKPLTKLIKKVDEATAANKDAHMGSFVVFLNETEELAARVKEVAQQEKIEHTVMSIDNPSGPQGYEVARDADVTVVLYTQHKVKANYAFKKGELKSKDIEAIVADVSRILPKE